MQVPCSVPDERARAAHRPALYISLRGHTMRLVYGYAVAVAAIMSVPPALVAQGQGQAETARAVAGGGITVTGLDRQDRRERREERPDAQQRQARAGRQRTCTSRPDRRSTYWNPANKAAGNYTVKATFTEPKYMSLNNHPHPYGIMIAGNDLGTPDAELPVLRGVRQRQLHRARLRPGAVPDERPRRSRTPPCTRPPARASR